MDESSAPDIWERTFLPQRREARREDQKQTEKSSCARATSKCAGIFSDSAGSERAGSGGHMRFATFMWIRQVGVVFGEGREAAAKVGAEVGVVRFRS